MPLTIIELNREDMRFSSGHFTIFSANKRERLHGHNFRVHALITGEVDDDGLTFDYSDYRQQLLALCRHLHEHFLLPSDSKFLNLQQNDSTVDIEFNAEVFSLLSKDVLVLPLRNITVEELARWFVEELTKDKKAVDELSVKALTIKISSGPGQSGSASWEK